MKISTVLRQAQALIENPERWTKGELAIDKSGKTTDPACDDAIRFCAVGAFVGTKCSWVKAADDYLEDFLGVETDSWNDSSTHLEVMLGFDFAILAAEDEGK